MAIVCGDHFPLYAYCSFSPPHFWGQTPCHFHGTSFLQREGWQGKVGELKATQDLSRHRVSKLHDAGKYLSGKSLRVSKVLAASSTLERDLAPFIHLQQQSTVLQGPDGLADTAQTLLHAGGLRMK